MTPEQVHADVLARVRTFVTESLAGRPTADLAPIAWRVHAWQALLCPVRRHLQTGPPTQRIDDIPAIPVPLFRTFAVGTVPNPAPVAFMTSGTTGATRGVHRMRSTALYDRAAVGYARKVLPALPTQGIALLADPRKAPESSLSHMVDKLVPDTSWHLDRGLDLHGLETRLATARGPQFMAATGFSLAAALAVPLPALPRGSVLMVTGGFKGRVHHVEEAELLDLARRRLRPERIVREYGMTELSSQFWDTGDGRYRGPAWLRAIAVDPWTGRVLPAGVPGQLRFVDLCNVDASIAIDTFDQGLVHADGSLTLMGRLPGSEPRGCSLTTEDLLR